ncbi:MAG: AtpZ/AtpI family protein [Candidatus Polarisedimenticolia bacterium]
MAEEPPPLAEAWRYTQAGMILVTPIAAAGFAGYWLDGRLGTGPWLLLAGMLLGMASGFISFFRFVLPPPDRGDRGGGDPGGGRG